MKKNRQDIADSSLTNSASNLDGVLVALSAKIEEVLKPLNYEIFSLEATGSGPSVLRLTIDRRETAITLADCEQASRALDEMLEACPEIEQLFHGAPYSLEVSSPGIDRPLRSIGEIARFIGSRARVQLRRPATETEIQNKDFFQHYPRAVSFAGSLLDTFSDAFSISVDPDEINKKVRKAGISLNIRIPMSIVESAHLEPKLSDQLKRSG